MNKKEELKQSIELCLDMIDFSVDPKTIIFFEEALQELSEEYKLLISKTFDL